MTVFTPIFPISPHRHNGFGKHHHHKCIDQCMESGLLDARGHVHRQHSWVNAREGKGKGFHPCFSLSHPCFSHLCSQIRCMSYMHEKLEIRAILACTVE